MTNVAVVTGGAGGIGLETARLIGRDHHVVISDTDPARLERALADLTRSGVACDASVCDVTDGASVRATIRRASEHGRVAAVIHAAGISPQMADPVTIMRVNAIGTVNVVEASLEVATDGFALVNVASMAAHLVPTILMPTRTYPLALTDPEAFVVRTTLVPRIFRDRIRRSGLAYSISKHFVVWLSRTSAGEFGEKGARVVSVSPGSIDTAMGRLEEKSGSAKMLETAALKRFGRPEEIAELLIFCASSRASYLTGVDVLCDGGVVAGRS